MRASLIRQEDSKYVFTYTMHHIISDAWSIKLMIREITNYYNLILKDQNTVLPALEIQYKDYEAWLRSQIENGQLDGQYQYWMKELEGDLQPVKFDYDKEITEKTTFRGNTIRFSLNLDLISKIEAIVNEHETTAFAFHLAALRAFYFYTLVRKISFWAFLPQEETIST